MRYVERNPVRAGIVTRAEDYPWSSAAAHCALREDMLLSGNCPIVAEIRNWSEWLRSEDSNATDDVIRRHSRTGRPLGSESFIGGIELQTGRKLLPQKRGPRSQATNSVKNSGSEKQEDPTTFRLFG